MPVRSSSLFLATNYSTFNVLGSKRMMTSHVVIGCEFSHFRLLYCTTFIGEWATGSKPTSTRRVDRRRKFTCNKIYISPTSSGIRNRD